MKNTGVNLHNLYDVLPEEKRMGLTKEGYVQKITTERNKIHGMETSEEPSKYKLNKIRERLKF